MKKVTQQAPTPHIPDGEVHWPPKYSPAIAPVHVRNVLLIDAPPDRVWACLIRAGRWPSWYSNSKNVRLPDGGALGDLALGTTFRWNTFGVGIESTVVEWEVNRRIAWNASGFGVDAYHAWVLTAHAGGCHVLTEETQYGWGARLLNFLMPQRMWKGHQLWLESMQTEVRKGLPPS